MAINSGILKIIGLGLGLVAGFAFGQSSAVPNDGAAIRKPLSAKQSQLLNEFKPSAQATAPAAQTVAPLTNRPEYKGAMNDRVQSEWLAEASSRLRNLRPPEIQWPRSTAPNFAGFGVLSEVIRALLIIALIAAAGYGVWLLSHVRRTKRAATAVTGLMTAEEALRSEDEWLSDADACLARGDYRLAIRCLYLATLLRMDRERMLRLVPHDTNWEHLDQWQRSPQYRADLDLRAPTATFDRVWYGEYRATPEMGQAMRTWYLQIRDSLARAR